MASAIYSLLRYFFGDEIILNSRKDETYRRDLVRWTRAEYSALEMKKVQSEILATRLVI